LEATGGRLVGWRRLALILAGVCGLSGLILEYGTYPGAWVLVVAHGLSTAAVVLFLGEQVLGWRAAGSFHAYLRRRWPTFALSCLLALQGLALLAGSRTAWLRQTLDSLRLESVTSAYLIIMQVYLVAIIVLELPHLHSRFAALRIRPALGFIGLFVGLIMTGAGLLVLPRATPVELPISALDALFTATSAVCVTGLTVRDTGTGFTIFGQTVIMILIQLGGLGIMSLTAALGLLLGRGIGVRENSLLREVFQVPMMDEMGRIIRGIIMVTLSFEAMGAAVLYAGFSQGPPPPGPLLFTAVFHSVSAFCNAGFGTYPDNLMSFAENPLVMAPIATLIIVGGLGFGVAVQVAAWWRGRIQHRHGRAYRLGLHGQVVLTMTAILLVAGCGLLAMFEWNGSLADGTPGLRVAQAFFQSTTCRTAGFNSMDLRLLTPASVLVMILLMYIGASPGSTGGGVKVSTVAIALANLRSIAQGHPRVRLGKREIDPLDVQRALLVLSSALVVASIAIVILLVTEGRDLQTVAFEVFSGLGTVGLSLGLTPELTSTGRVVLILLMFIGRLGPLTLASSLTGARHDSHVRLPRGRILIG
jgi:trk system potassium uptake protein TrkH